MLLEEEAKKLVRAEVARNQEEHIMQAARLKQVNLQIDTSSVESKQIMQVGLSPLPTPSSVQIQLGAESDYREKITLFLEMEKLKLITQAVAVGISESEVLDIMQESSLIDFSLEHLREIVK